MARDIGKWLVDLGLGKDADAFAEIVRGCMTAGLVGGERSPVDASVRFPW